MKRLFLVLLLALLASHAGAIDNEGPLPDPELQARYEQLTFELRCLVCQNQNIADSNADLAKDLRGQVREMLLAGKSDREILSFMTERYGDFVLYRPSLSPRNWLLWGAPLLFLGFGGFVLVRVIRRQTQSVSGDPDDPSDGRDA